MDSVPYHGKMVDNLPQTSHLTKESYYNIYKILENHMMKIRYIIHFLYY